VLIVATARDEEAPVGHPLRAMLRSLHSARNVDEIALERLGEDDVAAIVTRVDGLRAAGPDLARRLYAHSEGNALFLNEAIGIALDRGSAPEAVETSVATLIAARLRQLGSDARTIADIASVAGAGCSVPLVREVSNLSAAAAARGFDELLDRRLLREAGARAKFDYVFTHHLIADSIYREIEPAFRAQRHARIARVLEAGHGAASDAPAREIARHFERGGDAERAARWYLTAARQSSAVYAYGDTIELVTLALALTEIPDVRAALLDLRETAYGRRGDRAGQRADIDALDRLAGHDPAQRFDIIARRIAFARTLGESDEEGRLIGELGTIAEHLGDAARARALVQRATHAGLRSLQADGSFTRARLSRRSSG
jgi:predicted ATPase